jgi:outer membrane protein assembly factor BamB
VINRRELLSLGAVALASPRSALAALTAPRFRSRPDLDAPTIHVIAVADEPVPGLIFVANANGAGTPGPMILAGDGELVWFEPRPGRQVMNFAAHPYGAQRVLAWWEGTVTGGHGAGEFVVLDTSYRELTRIRAGNGLQADFHEFSITPRGSAILTAYDDRGDLLDSIVQEVDVASGAVLFEWRASDHIAREESYVTAPDFAHLNAAALDRDGDFLISSRHTWTIYKVDRSTGAIRWRLGG